MALYVQSGEETSKVLQPSGGGSGVVDVVNNYNWTFSNNKSEVPVALVTEYQINSGQLLAGLYYYAKQASSTVSDTVSNASWGLLERGGAAADDPYKFMYFATPTGFNYSFPWLGSDKFTRSSEFAHDESISGLVDIGKQALQFPNKIGNSRVDRFTVLAESAAKLNTLGKLAGSLGTNLIVGKVGLNSSKSWMGTSGQSYTIEFSLLNTFNNTNEIRKNRELAYLLTYQNSPFRRNFAILDPVCIYQLSIPDVVHFPACFVSDLKITNVGTTRLLRLDGENRTIPEAYTFSITFTSLLEESRNIFSGVDNSNNKVQAISDQHAWEQIVNGSKEFQQSILESGANYVSSFENMA